MNKIIEILLSFGGFRINQWAKLNLLANILPNIEFKSKPTKPLIKPIIKTIRSNCNTKRGRME